MVMSADVDVVGVHSPGIRGKCCPRGLADKHLVAFTCLGLGPFDSTSTIVHAGGGEIVASDLVRC